MGGGGAEKRENDIAGSSDTNGLQPCCALFLATQLDESTNHEAASCRHRLLRASLESRSGAGRTPFDTLDRGAVPLECRKRGVTGRQDGRPPPFANPGAVHRIASRKGLSVRTRALASA